jgi:hypothetical protein
MSWFQYLVVLLLLLLASLTVRAAARGAVRKRIATFWLLVWATVGVTSLWPTSTAIMARALGIGRGADLVLYCSVLGMLIGFFYIYTRFRRLDRTLTLLVRQLAIENPVPPAAGAGDASAAPDTSTSR